MYERRVEDYMDDPNDTYDNEYGVCTTVAGSGRRLADGTDHPKTLYIPDKGDYEQFMPGDRLFLDVDPKEADADVEPLSQYDRLGHARPAWTQFSSNDSYAVRVKAVKHIVPSDAARRRQLQLDDAFPPKDLISIRATYSDVGGPDYCDYNCVYQSMWGTPTQPVGYAGNLSRFLHDSSFGRLRWPASLGKVVNVNMNKAASTYGNCSGGTIASDVVAVADAAGHAASGYTHVEILLPTAMKNIGCSWGGLAQVGCSKPKDAPRAGACWSLIRSSSAPVRAHEFGHNIGLGHANSLAREYGDYSGVMGNDYRWRFFSLPNAWSAGFIPQSEIIDWGGRNAKWVLMDRSASP